MNLGSVVVTGGAGFLGSQLVRRLMPICDHIYIIDDLSTGNKDAIPHSERITLYEERITNEKVLEEVLPNVEYIFHFACKNLVLSVENMNDDFDTNLYGGYLLLQKAQECCPGLKRFIYASTTSIYSHADILPTPESYYNIKLPYAASKFSMEHYCHVYHQMYQLPVTILRFSNVYGPGQLATNPYCGVVAKFFEAVLNQQPMIIFGDGSQTRDFTYVEDAMDAVLLAVMDVKAIGHVYNVGTGIETSVLDLAKVVQKISGQTDLSLQFAPKRKVDVVQRRSILAEKIHAELNWKKPHSIAEGIAKTFAWLKEEEKSENFPRNN
ncbi:NAD-dependent epimerase/dehydratase family protein [Neobacillus sp. MM2021_6]|uniref:NAD-dependent epimerase/dehydratase family protein n=1 Tax=Bacillaceae TaxID=186817 RepID=UPI00140757E4|nr:MULTISPECIES: NAD-dependent epimerase/dehydratase family protein [Bacillaceae]MBO0961864.1 NAD-dependent epimerase/dehydratase family protein [Neobacillus sp. MM2021_6]NHC18969.1 NAD-dependent epimerase/dehydratase family protein [Bacillus sp. MM2020_4]